MTSETGTSTVPGIQRVTAGINGSISSSKSVDQNFVKRTWIPHCKDELKPYVKQIFKTIDEAHAFYTNYGRTCGFDVRRTTGKTYKGSVTIKYIVCNRAGKPYEKLAEQSETRSSESKQRMTISRRCQCNAKISLKFAGLAGYQIFAFIEEHNHEMVPEKARHLLRCNRDMSFPHQNFMFDCVKASLGPSKSHNVMTELVGGYENVGPTQTEYRNFQRDIKSYIGKKDADMIIEKFSNNRIHSDGGFYYDYKVDPEGHLSGLFWADPIGRKKFEVYHDVVSVDATYNTNCYSMVFVPFTGVDNHWKSVTFAAGLISKEDFDHYKWIFNCFHTVMGCSPSCIITDQDPSMAATIPQCLPRATHRLCMWHIMKKFQTKVGPAICSKTNFLERINKIIWSEFITQIEFEKSWNTIISEFKLQDNKWLHDMYNMRAMWIPAFFKDKFMIGLLRSTSRSESTNNYFNNFLKPGDTLVEFYMHFESAVQKQRHVHTTLTNASSYLPKFLTPKVIEQDAANIYTREIFLKVQEEIAKSCYNVSIVDIVDNDHYKIFKIKDDFYKDVTFEVQVTSVSFYTSCTCSMFIRLGYMCSHSFAALSSCQQDNIPFDMISNRWVKNAEERHVSLQLGEIHLTDDKSARIKFKVNKIWFNFQAVLAGCGMDEDSLDQLDEAIKQLLPSTTKYTQKKGVRLNDNIIEQLVGSKSGGEVVIQPPQKSRNKGCSKRLLSPAEHAVKSRGKSGRKCRVCGEVDFHDFHNCPKRPKCKDCGHVGDLDTHICPGVPTTSSKKWKI